ncbi:MAG: 30S processome protein Utp24 [archaeon]
MSFVVLKVILDSNMLMNFAQKRMDVFKDIEGLLLGKTEFIILEPVLKELERLASNHSKTGREASLAIERIRGMQILHVSAQEGETTDGLILRYASENQGIVATGDAELIRKARNANIPLIYLKGKSRLALEGLEPAYR